MENFEQQLHKYSAIARLFRLVSNTPQEQLINLLKQLLGESFTKNLFRMILEMPEDQQRLLLQRLEGLELEDGKIDRRGNARKPCLIGVTYTVQDHEYKSFILDISAFGVFIETRDFLPVGQEVNIGAGTITCNYDGLRKHPTIIEDGAFIGSDTMLVAPVRVGAGAKVGAGSVVTHDVPPGSVAYGVPARVKGEVREE